jgi:ribosome maturation factor RimP
MALKLDEIRALADRVAASHGLEIVDIEYQGGGGKHRTLRVFIEKNEGERAKLRERVMRLQAEREARDAEDDEASDNQADGAGASSEQPLEGDTTEEDEAFLDGLPSVTNLEFLSGVTHEDCEVFSRDFGTVLDVEELVPGTEYLLEISSPGLDRRLTRAEEYGRFVGSLVKIQTFEAVDGNRHLQGRILGVDEGRVRLEPAGGAKGKKAKKGLAKAAAEPAMVEIALVNVEKAHLVPEF